MLKLFVLAILYYINSVYTFFPIFVFSLQVGLNVGLKLLKKNSSKDKSMFDLLCISNLLWLSFFDNDCI